jgi:hypothetical protein
MAQFTLPNGHNYFVDSAGRILIFSCGIDGAELKDPRTLTKTTGKVLPSSNTCIDDARWQYIRNTLAPSSDDWRLAIASTDATQSRSGDSTTQTRSRLPGQIWDRATLNYVGPTEVLSATRNINKFRSYNKRALPNSLTDWDTGGDLGSSLLWCWDEVSGYSGSGLDYSGFLFSFSTGFGVYSHSDNPGFNDNSGSYYHRNLEMWILPPGVADFPTEEGYKYQLDGNGLSHNPGDPASNHQYGWFIRSGGTVTNPVGGGSRPFQGDCRQLVLVWDGVVIFDSIDSPVIVAPASGNTDNFVSWAGAGTSVIGRNGYSYPMDTNCGVVVGNYVYYPGTFQGSAYGWPSSGIGYSASSPNGDQCNGFQIKRRRYFPSTPTYTGNKTNGQTSSVSKNTTNIFFDVTGGRGGVGGAGYGNPGAIKYSHPGGYYTHGQRVCGYIKPHTDTLDFTHYVGGNGNNGSGNSRGTGGTGGAAAGGGGGQSGSFLAGDYYGGGGAGGGAASGLYISTYSGYASVASGGGSGGGGQWFDRTTDARVNPNFVFNSTVPSISSGSPGYWIGSPGANNAGGGGGGGGAPGGGGGQGSGPGNSIAGQGGFQGGGFADRDFVDYGFIVPDWLPGTTDYFGMGSSGANRIIIPTYHTNFVSTFGSSLSRNSNWNPNASVELYYYTINAQTYGEQVGIRLKLYDDGSWTQVKEMYIKDAGTWKLVQDCYIKKDGSWSPFYG